MADFIGSPTITKPIYVGGLARSGSTILLETLSSYPGIACHRYRDFPFIFTPVWWNHFLDRCPRRSSSLRPRVHGDGLLVSTESPEALEEPLWMAFFRDSHRRECSQVLDANTSHPRFEAFYRSHLQKVLAVRRGHRYACKANYHITRFEYLLKLFPDARFIVPIRRPREHVASLMKQDRLFRAGESRYPRSLAQMRACGHFEFGLDRRWMQTGDAEVVASIEKLWNEGQEARAWGRYWAHLYGFLADRVTRSEALQEAMEFVWFEDLCERPRETLRRIDRHCDLQGDDRLRNTLAERLHAPTYYRPTFSPAEEQAIEEETHDVVLRLTAEQFHNHRQAA